jgi:predicted methyltransferase
MRIFFFLILYLISNNLLANPSNQNDPLENAVKNQFRKKENKYRDKYRNPIETLTFFGIKRNMKVLEISPGSGWYTEILGNMMKDTGDFYVTKFRKPSNKVLVNIQNQFDDYFASKEVYFGKLKYLYFNENNLLDEKEKKFDLILTFRNTHNWLDSDTAENVYKSIYNLMEDNGILGVVQHRANESANYNYKKGYVKESFLIGLIEAQGFELIEKSEINANPQDLKNYEKGVWTLPPRFAEGEKNKLYYRSIGESDRMTLKFKKK